MKLARIGLKDYNGTYLGGIQLLFTNGIKSDLYQTNASSSGEFKYREID